MSKDPPPHSRSLALLTDLYELTMARGYWKLGIHQREAVFHLFFRRSPFGSAYAIACGLAPAAEFLARFRFEPEELEYLGSLTAPNGRTLFEPEFLRYLARLRLTCDIDAVPEGTAVFAREPLIRVRGPLLEAQLLETALLTLVNFPTLVATKASRVCAAAGSAPVLEFGLRRAQGVDGGLSASRAAWIGGVAATSNVLAAKRFGIPVRGTHAHSWVMSFEDEREAFLAWARVQPAGGIFLVDTYDSREGTRRALEAGRWLRERGHDLLGVRIDSGDLEQVSRQARRILDEGGFTEAVVMASGDLDEHRIARLRKAGAPIGAWGVGTRLATAYDQPALDGVYKLGAIRDADGRWRSRHKRSDDPAKSTLPGALSARRFRLDGRVACDAILAADRELPSSVPLVELEAPHRVRTPPPESTGHDLLLPLLRKGRLVAAVATAQEARERARGELAALPDEVRRLDDPARFALLVERDLLPRS